MIRPAQPFGTLTVILFFNRRSSTTSTGNAIFPLCCTFWHLRSSSSYDGRYTGLWSFDPVAVGVICSIPRVWSCCVWTQPWCRVCILTFIVFKKLYIKLFFFSAYSYISLSVPISKSLFKTSQANFILSTNSP